MPRVLLLLSLIAASVFTSHADAQLMFDTTFEQYEHPKSDWERWAKTKPGDFIEYSDGTKVFARFEAIEVSDHAMKVRTTTFNEFQSRPDQRDIRHLFNQDEPAFGKPTSVTDDKLQLGETEFAAKRWEYLGPDKARIKEVWYSDDAPFDGMLKYQQYTLGKPSAERIITRFRKGQTSFGKVDEPAAVPAQETPKPLTPQPAPIPKTEVDPPAAADPTFRTWTSADGKQTIEAEIIRVTATSVVLKRKEDGKTFNLALKQLSQADRDYLKELRKAPKK